MSQSSIALFLLASFEKRGQNYGRWLTINCYSTVADLELHLLRNRQTGTKHDCLVLMTVCLCLLLPTIKTCWSTVVNPEIFTELQENAVNKISQ